MEEVLLFLMMHDHAFDGGDVMMMMLMMMVMMMMMITMNMKSMMIDGLQILLQPGHFKMRTLFDYLWLS